MIKQNSETRESKKKSMVERFAQSRLLKRLERLDSGRILVEDSDMKRSFGTGGDLDAHVRVVRPRFYQKMFLGSVAIADSYVAGDWDCNDLSSLFRIFLRNRKALELSRSWLAKLVSTSTRCFHGLHANTVKGSRKNIAAHYDLGNDFFKLWLDDTMAYSAGIFLEPSDSLQEASEEKFNRVCRKLNLQPDDELIEIGTGFGGMSIHAAENYHCNVTTTTISHQQYREAEARIGGSVAAGKIELLQSDYRELNGKFDKLVSIEMIEAVGHRFLDVFFRKCSKLLKEDGTMVLQAITMPERHHDRYLNSVDFLQRYIFPGGCLPSLASILKSVGRASDLRFVHAEDMAPHYAETLRRWRNSFLNSQDSIRQLGYSEELLRMWNFYLCYCEAAFEERYIGVLQIQFDKPKCRRDPIEIGTAAASTAIPRRAFQRSNIGLKPKGAKNGFSRRWD